MRKLCILLLSLAIAGDAFAQSVTDDLVGLGMKPEVAEYIAAILPGGSVLGNDTFLKGRNQANSADISILKVDTTDDTMLNADTGDLINFAVAKTPVAVMGATGFTTLPIAGNASIVSDKSIVYTGYVPTLAATPVAATNDFKLGLNVIPTAAANAAAILPTPVSAGVTSTLINTGPNAVRVKAGGTNTINGSAAGAYIPLAIAAQADCIAESATNWRCSTSVVPTPAGP